MHRVAEPATGVTEPQQMAKQNITLKIIGKPYSLSIDSEKEELYRLAERELNAYVTRIEQAHFKGFSKEDCLAMAAFQIAVAKLSLAQSREVGDEDVRALAALGGEVESYLDALR